MSEARRVKSRAGCQQCKRRKVKCDLSVPSCRQCIRQKLLCPGYQKALKWKDGSEDLNSASSKATDAKTLSNLKIAKYLDSDSNSLLREKFASLQSPSVPNQLNDESSSLIHHYFTRVCRIAGCFDSDISPFRILASAMMAHSKPVFLLLQASSAAQLSSRHPQMRLKAIALQSEAFSTIRKEINGLMVTDELMLSSIIAGLTSAWYDVDDIGLSHVLGSQVLLTIWLSAKGRRLGYQQTFILGAYVYWFMISAFAAGDPWESFHYQEALQETVRDLELTFDVVGDADEDREARKIYPHPLTGFSIDLCISIGKVGALCRLQHNAGAHPESLDDFLLEKALAVESDLLDNLQTYHNNFQDPKDPETTIDEILRVGEAYRCVGLLQLYATFPLLSPTLPEVSSNHEHSSSETVLLDEEQTTLNSTGGLSPAQHNWLRSLAMHSLSLLETIPPTSGTRVLQGLPVLIAGSWLVDIIPSNTVFNHPFLPLKQSCHPKEHWRELVREGLRSHNEFVGLQQVSRVLEILEEVWRLDDEGCSKCDWMVVVATRGLQTLYG